MRHAMAAWRPVQSLIYVLMLGLCIGSAYAAPTPETARAMIDQVGKEVLGVLGNAELNGEQQQTQLIELLQRAINLDITGRLILGKQWRTATPEQREEYLKLFKPYALANLASRIRASNAKVPLQTFTIVDQKALSDSDLVVSTDLFWPGYPPYRLDWRLRDADDGTVKAIDVVVQGVSMVVSQRSEFGSVISRDGLEGLLEQMRRQVERPA